MAYPASRVLSTSGVAATSFVVTLSEHAEGDVVFLSVMQGGGTNNILTPPGAPWVVVNNAGAVYAAQTILYAVAGAAPLDPPQFTSSVSGIFNAVSVTIADADASSPVLTSGRTNPAISSIVGPSLTTAEDAALVLHFFGFPAAAKFRTPLSTIPLALDIGNPTCYVGYTVAESAGVHPAVTGNSTAGNGPNVVSVAVRNKVGGALPPQLLSYPRLLTNYGFSPNATNSGSLANIAANIAGMPVLNGTIFTAILNPAGEYLSGTQLGGAGAGTGGAYLHWVGSYQPTNFTADLTGRARLAFRIHQSSTVSVVASGGIIMVLIDSSSNWSAYKVTSIGDLTLNTGKAVVLQPSALIPIDSSATPPNLADITRVGWAYNRAAISSANGFGFSIIDFSYLADSLTVVGGSEKSPASMRTISDALSTAKYAGLFSQYGKGLTAAVLPVQIGKHDVPTYASLLRGSSVEFAAVSSDLKFSDTETMLTLEAASTSAIDLSFSSFLGANELKVKLSPQSSPSASYSLTASTFVGMRVEWASGVACYGANFFESLGVDSAGSVFSGCAFSGRDAITSLSTSNPANISDCTFTQGDSGGHAIEITQPGTYSFVGNTFDGYGLDGTTDAAIYNNSGGHVTLNVSGGGDTPTVRNGAGATTEVVSGAQITVVGLAAGSQVKVTKVSDGAVLFNGPESLGEVSFSTTYIGAVRVEARKASASPFYRPWATQATTISGQTVEVTALQELDE